MDPVIVNGRYAARPVTGVERVAIEVLRHLTVEHRVVGDRWGQGARGHLSEQIVATTDRQIRRAVLWSPANTGPLLHPRHVVTIHDVATLRHPEFFSRRFSGAYRLLLSGLGRTATKIVTPSRFTAAELTDLGIVEPSRIEVIRNGVDSLASGQPPLLPSDAFVEGLPPEYLLVVGSMDPRKNLGRLVAAYERARSSSQLPPLLIAGGTGRAFAPSVAERTENVRHLGRVGDDELEYLYATARGVLNVSLYEGFGLTVAEAARHRSPLLVSDIPPHRELLDGDAGVIWTNPTDVASMADGLSRLLSLGRGDHVVDGHSWASAGAQYGALLASLSGEAR